MILGIDLGSNTLRAVLMDENLTVIKEAEFIVAAAKNLSQNNLISNEAIARLKNALRNLKEQNFDLTKARAVATAAFRKAKNTELIFKEIKDEFNIEFKLIDAKEEARLSVLGMQNALNKLGIKDKELLFCDLGGASCELSFANTTKSFDFGIISFYEKAMKAENLGKNYKISSLKTRDKILKFHFLLKDRKLKNIAILAFKEVFLAKSFLRKSKAKKIVLNSGVPTALVALKQGLLYEEYNASLINGKKLYRGDFLYYGLKLWYMSEEKACLLVGKNRKNYLVAGCFLLYALFEKEELIVVDEGIREGICIDFMQEFRC